MDTDTATERKASEQSRRVPEKLVTRPRFLIVELIEERRVTCLDDGAESAMPLSSASVACLGMQVASWEFPVKGSLCSAPSIGDLPGEIYERAAVDESTSQLVAVLH